MDHARGAKFAKQFRVFALEAGVAHVELMLFAFIAVLFIIVVVGARQFFLILFVGFTLITSNSR